MAPFKKNKNKKPIKKKVDLSDNFSATTVKKSKAKTKQIKDPETKNIKQQQPIVIFDENSVIKNAKEFDVYQTKHEEQVATIKKEKPQINQDKVDLLKHKFNFLRKVKPLKFRKSNLDDEKAKFDPRKADKNKYIDMNAIWEKNRKQRSSEEKYYYRKEVRTYHKYFFLYLSREIRRTRWTPRKQLNIKFWQTVLFIAFFAGLFAILQTILLYLFPLIHLS